MFSLESLANGASQDVLLEVQQQTMGYLLDERLNKLEEVAQVCVIVYNIFERVYMHVCATMDKYPDYQNVHILDSIRV